MALAESKFGGTELENEQIGQTQVPVDFGTSDCTDGDLKGLLVLVTGEDEDDSLWTDLGLNPSSRGRGDPKPSFEILG